MKILYAIQGTGNGHVSRAREIAPVLERFGTIHYLLSGDQADLETPFDIHYRTGGVSLYFGKKGGVDLARTYQKNNVSRLLKEIRQLPVEKYDLILNDFEPVSAWAARKKNVRCVALSHQCALTLPGCPMPSHKDPMGMAILRHFAPSDTAFGFHFQQFHPNAFTPIIRKDLRQLEPVTHGHYTVYLPAYSDERIAQVLKMIPHVRWEIFSKKTRTSYQSANLQFSPVHDTRFAHSLRTCTGILCGAGFETPSEAIYLGKKLMVIPMKNQFEQQCNAEALRQLGVPVLKSLKPKNATKLFAWVDAGKPLQLNYPDQIESILESILFPQKNNCE